MMNNYHLKSGIPNEQLYESLLHYVDTLENDYYLKRFLQFKEIREEYVISPNCLPLNAPFFNNFVDICFLRNDKQIIGHIYGFFSKINYGQNSFKIAYNKIDYYIPPHFDLTLLEVDYVGRRTKNNIIEADFINKEYHRGK